MVLCADPAGIFSGCLSPEGIYSLDRDTRIDNLSYECLGASQVVLVIKNLLAGDARDLGSIPGLEISPGGRHGNPLQYSCLENTMDRGAWWATVHGITQSWAQLK